jgi:hypothetical protein
MVGDTGEQSEWMGNLQSPRNVAPTASISAALDVVDCMAGRSHLSEDSLHRLSQDCPLSDTSHLTAGADGGGAASSSVRSPSALGYLGRGGGGGRGRERRWRG